MLDLDGSEGGGQLLRTALSLSAVETTPFRMTGVRGSRPEPGLKPQHLTAVETMAAVTDAEVTGAELGSEELTFEPGPPTGGDYEADVGTAGSVTLLFDALLPVSVAVEAPLAVRARGGTDVQWSPPLDYARRVKLPLLRRHGIHAVVDPRRRGFYPAGGGDATLRLVPSSPSSPSLTDRAPLAGARVYSVASAGLADDDVAERQASEAARLLSADGVDVVRRSAAYATADSPGSALVVRLDYSGGVAGFDALGEPGKPAETVAVEAVEQALSFREGSGAVDDHLADQLLPLLALAGGEVAAPRVTDHVHTSLEIVRAFGHDVALDSRADGGTVLRG